MVATRLPCHIYSPSDGTKHKSKGEQPPRRVGSWKAQTPPCHLFMTALRCPHMARASGHVYKLLHPFKTSLWCPRYRLTQWLFSWYVPFSIWTFIFHSSSPFLIHGRYFTMYPNTWDFSFIYSPFPEIIKACMKDRGTKTDTLSIFNTSIQTPKKSTVEFST